VNGSALFKQWTVVMPRNNSNIDAGKVGWRVNEWADAMGLGRAFTYQLIQEGKLKSVKLGGARIITIAPAEYLRHIADDL
jgi:excisionase family DNA binding protein